MKNKSLYSKLFVIALCIPALLCGCSKTEDAAEVAYKQEKEVAEDEITTEEAFIEETTTQSTPEDLFNAFCEGQISAEARSYYDDATWTMNIGDYQLVSDPSEESGDVSLMLSKAEPVDLDNDGEPEYVLVNPVYGDMCFDCKDDKVICFAQGEGTTAYCSFTKYDDAYWIVHSDTIHEGRCTYNLIKFNGNLEVVDSFDFGWEDWDGDGIKRFYLDDQDITVAEYEELLNAVIPNPNP